MTNPGSPSEPGVDRLYRLLPPHLQQVPIRYDYAADVARDELLVEHLRGLQNLAAEATGEQTPFGIIRGEDSPTVTTARGEALETALREAARVATADGVPADGIQRAIAFGRAGMYWHQQPSDPVLGRMAAYRQATEAAQERIADLEVQLGQVPGFVADAWGKAVAGDLSAPHTAAAADASRGRGVDAASEAGDGWPQAGNPIGGAIADTMSGGVIGGHWAPEPASPHWDAGSGIGGAGAER
ncbi:hypothetical protein IU459_35385 [Nocardia amamiensis]|uniref:Uncharacterized protein n=1 Tax=Nocardia amamiensis TaxID=404578 RepID=A0ABS0D1T2_9NOCA|nr:hypothetical protein [Nocardia amamiensis]MBF6302779.1 hypothetical protein [Nocardia amamiensis]